MTRSQSPLMICARASSITGDQHDNATRGMSWGKGGLDGRRHTTLFSSFPSPDMRDFALSVPAKISAYVL